MQSRQDMVAVLAVEGRGRWPMAGELISGGLISYQGKEQRDMPFTTPLISYH